MNRRVVMWVVVFLLAACAPTRAVFQIGPGTDAEGQPIVWPSAPEVPRFMYLGELTGERNFHREGEQAGQPAGHWWKWLVGFGEDQYVPLELQRPQSGLVDESGRIYVTDSSKQAVFVFDEINGELLVWDVAEPQAKFVSPAGIVLGNAGEILVADAELGVVERLRNDGAPLGTIGRGILKRPIGLARDPVNKRLYVADARAHDIKVFDDGGKLLKTIGRRGSGVGEFNFPTYLAFAKEKLYVTDSMNNRVQIFEAGGKPIGVFGQRGLFIGNLVRPKGVAVDDEGNIYVIESYYDHMLVFDSAGELLLAIGGTGKDVGHFYLPAGIWMDRNNRVFVADMFNGRIAVFQFLGGS